MADKKTSNGIQYSCLEDELFQIRRKAEQAKYIMQPVIEEYLGHFDTLERTTENAQLLYWDLHRYLQHSEVVFDCIHNICVMADVLDKKLIEIEERSA